MNSEKSCEELWFNAGLTSDGGQALVESLGGRPGDEDAIGRMVQLIVSMPEYQLC